MKTNKLVLTAFFLVLGILIPFISAHGFGVPGTLLLPMHLSVLVGGFVLGPIYGLILGVLTPLLSMMMTAMPSSLMLPIMMCELALYGFACGFAYRKLKLNVYVSLISAMVIGRIGYALTLLFFTNVLQMGNYAKIASVFMAITNGAAGIILQLILVPILVKVLKRYIDNEYNK